MVLIAPPLKRMPSVTGRAGCEPDTPCIQKDPLKKTHIFVNLRRAQGFTKICESWNRLEYKITIAPDMGNVKMIFEKKNRKKRVKCSKYRDFALRSAGAGHGKKILRKIREWVTIGTYAETNRKREKQYANSSSRGRKSDSSYPAGGRLRGLRGGRLHPGFPARP